MKSARIISRHPQVGIIAALLVAIISIQAIMSAAQVSTADTSETNLSDASKETQSTPTELAPFLLRLHLIRHGETHANVQNLVLGQGDSPLTSEGLAVARLAAASDVVNGKKLRYWRTYCSDLYRAHRTARIVLGLEEGFDSDKVESAGNKDNPNTGFSDAGLIVDARLRELAKGAREGFDKSLSYDEALKARQNGSESQVPLLESIDDAWNRVQDWIEKLIYDASSDYYSSDGAVNNGNESGGNESIDDSGKSPRIYDVFALSHSALIRTTIHKMVDSQLPSDYAKTREGSLRIPNLSRTIIDVRPYHNRLLSNVANSINENDTHGECVENVNGKKIGNWKWEATLVKLSDVSHLQHPSSNGPPYL